MNFEEFLRKLRQTPRDWRLDTNGEIRRCLWAQYRTRQQCPVSALCNVPVDMNFQVRAVLHITDELYVHICAAADNHVGAANFSAEMRQQLLEACGL